MKGNGGMGRHTGGDDGPSGSQGQSVLESVCDRVMDPVETGARWWEWYRWGDCGQK
jgi:hypothetical protein